MTILLRHARETLAVPDFRARRPARRLPRSRTDRNVGIDVTRVTSTVLAALGQSADRRSFAFWYTIRTGHAVRAFVSREIKRRFGSSKAFAFRGFRGFGPFVKSEDLHPDA